MSSAAAFLTAYVEAATPKPPPPKQRHWTQTLTNVWPLYEQNAIVRSAIQSYANQHSDRFDTYEQFKQHLEEIYEKIELPLGYELDSYFDMYIRYINFDEHVNFHVTAREHANRAACLEALASVVSATTGGNAAVRACRDVHEMFSEPECRVSKNANANLYAVLRTLYFTLRVMRAAKRAENSVRTA